MQASPIMRIVHYLSKNDKTTKRRKNNPCDLPLLQKHAKLSSMTIQQAKLYGKNELVSSPTPQLDTEVILQHLTGFDKTHLLLNRDFELTENQESDFRTAIKNRQTGLPVAYITGHKEFFGYDFYVTPDVLIPKPDTEILVETAIERIKTQLTQTEAGNLTLCDMCSGSGCVGISILKSLEDFLENPNSSIKITFVDISEAALKITRKNAERLLSKKSLENARFLLSNLFENVSEKFDVIATNPPYVPHDESVELLTDGRSEPLLALDGDVNENGETSGTNDGLSLIRRLIPQAAVHMNPNGFLALESGEYNAAQTAKLFATHGFTNVRTQKDLNDMPRVTSGSLPTPR